MSWLNELVIRVAACAALGVAAGVPAAYAQEKKPDAPAAAAAGPAAVNAPAEPAGMVRLFKADSLDGWDGDPKLWRVADGVVTGQTTKENPAKGNTFLIWKGGELTDFELRLAFRIRTGNSGVQFRSKRADPNPRNPDNRWVVKGYQAEVENTPGKVGFLYHEGGPGNARGYEGNGNYLCKVGDKVEVDATGRSKVVGSLGDKAAIAASYKPGDWNEYIIIAEGNHVRQFVNGVQTVDLTDNDEKNRMAAGILALQLHAGNPMVVEFKDVRLKKGTAAAGK